jgi:hypothetical protein
MLSSASFKQSKTEMDQAAWSLKMKALQSLETLKTAQPVTRHVPEDFSPQTAPL